MTLFWINIQFEERNRNNKYLYIQIQLNLPLFCKKSRPSVAKQSQIKIDKYWKGFFVKTNRFYFLVLISATFWIEWAIAKRNRFRHYFNIEMERRTKNKIFYDRPSSFVVWAILFKCCSNIYEILCITTRNFKWFSV